jgi:hypothetical protein
MHLTKRQYWLQGMVLCLAAILVSCTESEAPKSLDAPIVITSLSNRADLISAGNVFRLCENVISVILTPALRRGRT